MNPLSEQILGIARDANEAALLKAKLVILRQHIASLVLENRSLRAQLRACGKRPAVDFLTGNS